jgi:hypothetical protein
MTDAQSEYLRERAESRLSDDELGAQAYENKIPIDQCPAGVDERRWRYGWETMRRLRNPCVRGECGS